MIIERGPRATMGTQARFSPPEVGSVIARDFAVWRVISVTSVPPVDWTDDESANRRDPYRVVVRPVAVTGVNSHHDADVSLRCRKFTEWRVYDDPEHYPVCGHCGGAIPCRWQAAQRAGERALVRMTRYETAGVCPACEEPVTTRQASLTWPDNLEVLGGPPVTFHLRRKCHGDALEYERRWVATAPDQRRAKLTCDGMLVNHGDGTYECDADYCPGPTARHRVSTVCADRCTDPTCVVMRGTFGCFPAPHATRRSDT